MLTIDDQLHKKRITGIYSILSTTQDPTLLPPPLSHLLLLLLLLYICTYLSPSFSCSSFLLLPTLSFSPYTLRLSLSLSLPSLTLSQHCHAMVNDEWVGAAMTNDMVVVELLIHLRQSQVAPKSRPLTAAAAPLSWGLKQPRSRLTPRWKDADSTRCSPTTPLSWSGAASPSITADGCEESSRPSLVSQQASRSKASATATSECTGNSASTKRCRKSKTFAELKEEESVLLKERIYLEKEIATLSATFKEQRTRNESLKRFKFDLGATRKNSPSSASGENTLCKVQAQAAEDGSDPQSDWKAGRTESSGESGFLIPDLNMMPSEGDSSYVE